MSAASLYRGKVMHARMKPKAHRFSYKVYSLFIDIGKLEEADKQSPLFSVNRFNLLAFHEGDFGDGRARGLRDYVDRALAQAGLTKKCAKVQVLCYPRLLGFAFNPLAIYYCFDAGGALRALIYEVRNTFGQKHSYVAPLTAAETGAPGARQERAKLFYVSPFLDMAMTYRFRLSAPAENLHVRILETDAEGPVLAATFSGTREPLTTASLLRSVLAVPLLTFKVVAGIHYEALKLWWKGVSFKPRPAPPPARSVKGRFQGGLDPAPDRTTFKRQNASQTDEAPARGRIVPHS
jgi:uncharacterized protein